MNARGYYLSLQGIIHAAPHVVQSDVRFEEIDINECYVRGGLTLVGGFELQVAEYVITEPAVTRPKYRYHLQTATGELVCRWDNAPHYPVIATFPDHRHDQLGQVHPSNPMTVADVLNAVLQFI